MWMILLEKGRWRWDYYDAFDEELILILGSKLFEMFPDLIERSRQSVSSPNTLPWHLHHYSHHLTTLSLQ